MAADIIARGLAASAKKGLDGKADLVNGKVPASQLPSYVDDVEEYPSLSDFPAEGEEGKLYVAIDTGLTYRWSGSTYVPVGGGSFPPCPVSSDGDFVLRATVSDGVVSYYWVKDTVLWTSDDEPVPPVP